MGSSYKEEERTHLVWRVVNARRDGRAHTPSWDGTAHVSRAAGAVVTYASSYVNERAKTRAVRKTAPRAKICFALCEITLLGRVLLHMIPLGHTPCVSGLAAHDTPGAHTLRVRSGCA